MRSIMMAAGVVAVAAGQAAAQHGGDVLVRIAEGRLQTGAVGGGGVGVYPERVFEGTFGAHGAANFTDEPGVNSEAGALPPSMALGFDLVAALREWDGEGFDAVSDDTVTVRDAGVTLAVTPATDAVVAGDVFGVSGPGPAAVFHAHLQWFLNHPSPTPADGVWLVAWRLWTDKPGVGASDTIYSVLAQGEGVAEVEDAVAWVEANLAGGGCPADIDANAVLNVDDVDAFASAFLGMGAAADLDGNALFNVDDVDAFVASFLAGCP